TLKIIIFIYAVLYFVFIISIKRGKNIENIKIPFFALFSKKLLLSGFYQCLSGFVNGFIKNDFDLEKQ
ncbi:MAG TPA: hypothetical protein PKZ21_06390, partial [Bacteroidales bacterium]|nr:hypothetical protein [Bacteroidales bacterium]